MILASGIDGDGVFMVFGAMQIATALIYGIPMPVQPLKAVALLVITQKHGWRYCASLPPEGKHYRTCRSHAPWPIVQAYFHT
jgi:hypothetical protein